MLDALRTGRFYGSTGPVIHDVDTRDGEVVVRCTPARSVTLLTGRTSGTAVNAGRLGYRHGAHVLETTPDDLVVAARLDRPETAPFARVEVVDREGQEGVDEPALSASAAREALERTSFDLLVIGGGVIGAATAAHAAREGLAVALVDAGDFGGGTSSASSKLIHGGLRYLRLGDVRPGSRGAPRAARADRTSWRRTSFGASRSCSRSTAAARTGPPSCRPGSSSTRPSPGRG